MKWSTLTAWEILGLAVVRLTALGARFVERGHESDVGEVPWRVIKDRRDRLTHCHQTTDDDVVRATFEEDLPRINRLNPRVLT